MFYLENVLVRCPAKQTGATQSYILDGDLNRRPMLHRDLGAYSFQSLGESNFTILLQNQFF